MKNLFLPLVAVALIASSCTSDATEKESVSTTIEEGTNTSSRTSENLTVTIPAQIVRGESVVFRGNAGTMITKVQVNVGGYDLGTPVNVAASSGYWSKTHTFSQAGNDRVLTLTGLSSSGAVIATKTYTIDVLNVGTPVGSYIQNVPYFYQRANQLNPGESCQNTCIAMILRYYAQKEGKSSSAINSETPDKITGIYGRYLAQTVPGFQRVFNERASALGLAARDAGSSTMPLATFRAKAASAATTRNPLSVHIYTTPGGHLVNVLGFDGTHYIVHDPYGKWNGVYQSPSSIGYTPGATIGVNVRYAKSNFEAAASPDGMVWVHCYQ
ncbi:MAG TPA: C39 family peptidase [Flavobacterium sp.]